MFKRTAILLLACMASLSATLVKATKTRAGFPCSTARASTAGRPARSQGTFTVKDGMLVVNGPRSHLYYVGPVNGATTSRTSSSGPTS